MRYFTPLAPATLSLITLTLAGLTAAACSGTTTVVSSDGPATAAPDDAAAPVDAAPIDPSTQGDPTSKDTPAPPLVKGLAITDVAVLQGVTVPVVTAGAAVPKAERNAPVVTGRGGLVRVYVSPGSGYQPTAVTAQLRLVSGTTRLATLEDTKTIKAASTEGAAESTFNFEVTADQLPAGVTYQVFLTDPKGVVPTGPATARFPNDGGVQSLEVEAAGALQLVVVPIVYNADGSGRTPDVSPAQLAKYKQSFMARYPVTDVSVTARAPWDYAGAISANGSGFSQVLQAITSLRRADGAADDVYYYGAFAPKATFSQYCGGSCVTGLSTVVTSASASNAFLRASVGVGFSGDGSVRTATHEVGHAHGRSHAPCGGASGVDQDFPYSDGSIGVWGYDILTKTLLDPGVTNDLMGYCENEWVSDYTFAALFDRVAQVNGGSPSAASSFTGRSTAPVARPVFATPRTFRTATLDGRGNATWSGEMDLEREPDGGETREVTFQSAAGQALGAATAHFYPYDHLPGGMLVMPAAPRTTTAGWRAVKIPGVARSLPR
ncbi:MAG: hypothetical protein JWP97_5010 [Labilithrix sp.]|nr:hypothetical protein [Labilithrix sp.]